MQNLRLPRNNNNNNPTHTHTHTTKIFCCCCSITKKAWFVSFLTDMLFVKHVCDTHPANGMERTLYQNALATPVLALALAVGADGSGSASEAAGTLVSEITGLAMVLASCLAGLCLSYTGLSLRSEVSSTAFAVLGVVTLVTALKVRMGPDLKIQRC